MNIKIFRRCTLFPSWSGQGLISSPVQSSWLRKPKNISVVSEEELALFRMKTNVRINHVLNFGHLYHGTLLP
jgi:hypothetical protein